MFKHKIFVYLQIFKSLFIRCIAKNIISYIIENSNHLLQTLHSHPNHLPHVNSSMMSLYNILTVYLLFFIGVESKLFGGFIFRSFSSFSYLCRLKSPFDWFCLAWIKNGLSRDCMHMLKLTDARARINVEYTLNLELHVWSIYKLHVSSVILVYFTR